MSEGMMTPADVLRTVQQGKLAMEQPQPTFPSKERPLLVHPDTVALIQSGALDDDPNIVKTRRMLDEGQIVGYERIPEQEEELSPEESNDD